MTGVSDYNLFHSISSYFIFFVGFGSLVLAGVYATRAFILFYRNVFLQIFFRLNINKETRSLYKGRLAPFKFIKTSFFYFALMVGASIFYKEASSAAFITGSAIENRTQNQNMREVIRKATDDSFTYYRGSYSGHIEDRHTAGLVKMDASGRTLLRDEVRFIQQGHPRINQILQAPMVLMNGFSKNTHYTD